MKYFSMFSGIGGFELGIEKAMESINRRKNGGSKEYKARNQRQRFQSKKGKATENENRQCDEQLNSKPNKRTFNCIGFSEIDKYTIQTYQRHFPTHKNYGDATKINPEELPDFDMLCGGFPCQSFSIAGKRLGFKDTRGTLFFEIARIAERRKPKILFLENVKGLLSHNNGRTIAVILATLDELGYNAEWQVLNSKHFGVPQNRERVFIIGHLRGKSGKQVFPIGEGQEFFDKERTRQQGKEQGICGTIDSRYGALRNTGEPYLCYSTKDSKMEIKQEYRVYEKEGVVSPIQGTFRKLVKQSDIRRLTPIECERLQGFPDGWTEGVSDTQRYKQLGNAVTVNVIEAIVRNIK